MTEEQAEQPATKGAVEHAQWSINLTTLIATGSALLTLVAALLVGGWFLLGQAEAKGRAAAVGIVEPVLPRVSFLEASLPFIMIEVRAVREEQRALAQKGPYATELARPMAPLPVPPDGGP